MHLQIAIIISLTITALGWMFVWGMPKRLTKQELYVSFTALAALNTLVDIIGAQQLGLYYMGESNIVEPYSVVIETFLGSSFGLIFLNYMPQDWRKFIPYLTAWVVLSLAFELFQVKIGYLIYTGWSIWYSAVSYPLIFLFLRWHIFFLRKGVSR